jgi:hypothetical protein
LPQLDHAWRSRDRVGQKFSIGINDAQPAWSFGYESASIG